MLTAYLASQQQGDEMHDGGGRQARVGLRMDRSLPESGQGAGGRSGFDATTTRIDQALLG